MITENLDEKINLEEVYKDLSEKHIIRNKRENSLLRQFSKLLGSKSSFSSHVHKVFSTLVK